MTVNDNLEMLQKDAVMGQFEALTPNYVRKEKIAFIRVIFVSSKIQRKHLPEKVRKVTA
jgi:hypothetical protein